MDTTQVQSPQPYPPDGSVEWHARKEAMQAAYRIADDLTALADRIRSEADEFTTVGVQVLRGAADTDRAPYSIRAARVVSAITNGLAGAGLSGLIRRAAEADAYRAQRLAGGQD